MKMETINWLFIFVIVVLAYYSIRGGKLGFVRTIFSMLSIFIALAGAYILSPYISEGIQKNDTFISAVEKAIQGNETKSKDEDKEHKQKEGEKIEDSSDSDINWQQFISEFIGDSSNKEDDSSDFAKIEKETKELVASKMIIFFVNIISFVCAFLIIRIILAILCNTLDIVSKLPVLNGLNKLSGFLAGILHGLLNIWIGCIILTVFSNTEIGGILFQYIKESTILTAIYSQNILLKIFI